MSGILSALIGIFERLWLSHPRRDLTRSLVELRDAMTRTQDAYRRHCRVVEAGGDYVASHSDWLRNVAELEAALQHVKVALEIHAPKAHQQIRDYTLSEQAAVAAGPEPQDLASLYDAARREIDRLDLEEVWVEKSFGVVRAELDLYLRQNFTAEEIHRASGT
ncbi:hypothetical protein [Paracoccus rhizosphaerae]|uniref:Uncharacterized protein n=1 Tax=Paracoccus rhizosphaerae TaxID=1133347 RepID=A0ABV6CNC1_9RHOB|nr:hypothetical protein [Paracoccus rhizosphaerae]